MTSLQEFRCEICGRITNSPNHWFVIQCSDSELTVPKWNSIAANAPGARHFCGEGHAQVYISRWFACMGGEPLLRPDFIHKVVYYAAKKGFWVYIATNGRLLRPEVADRLGDAGVSVFNFALDSWELMPSLPKAFVPAQKNLEHILRKQYVYDYLVFFNINICRNNLEDVKMLTEYAHDNRIATDYHINETPMLEQDEHFKHLSENPTYFRPEDWRDLDGLVDWIIEKNKAGYQMVRRNRRAVLSHVLRIVRLGQYRSIHV